MARSENKVRVRFSPSPTGHFHVGSARTALFNWLFARQRNGAFILRIEDTDASRSDPTFEKEIFESLRWLALSWDEGPDIGGNHGPYRQSERGELYRSRLQSLLDEGKAYYCYCSKEELEAARESFLAQGLPPKYSGHCRELTAPPSGKQPELIRFKTPEAPVEFKDMIRGTVTFDAGLFGDIAIAKGLTTPFYNFAVVVDDELMGISHVIRGEDHISNTPKQILIAHALGFETPQYAHIPLILNPDRSKLSKRYGETSLLDYRAAGYLPAAMVNFLALLGWHPKDDREIFSLPDLTEEFDLKRAQKGGAVFDREKLDWLNHEHLTALPEDDATGALGAYASATGHPLPPEKALALVRLLRDRAKTLKEFLELGSFVIKLPEYDPALLVWKNDAPAAVHEILVSVAELFKTTSDMAPESIRRLLAPLVLERGQGSVLWPLRVAISGLRASPDPFVIIQALGKKEVLRRIGIAVEKLGNI